ncbi:MAG: DUF362 domain-containing protein [Desulfatibacillaceae bacterium]
MNLFDVDFPAMALVRQNLVSRPLPDPRGEVLARLGELDLSGMIRPGGTAAVCVGSRNIDQLPQVVRACVDCLAGLGLSPFIVPAMGSHGGATPEGQTAVLEGLGVLAACPDVPVRADMGAGKIGRLDNGTPVFAAATALAADHVVVINRVKHHTKFNAPVESGLCKMLAIGLGKAEGAREYHRAAVRHGFGILEEAGLVAAKHCGLLFGLALVEDGTGRLSMVRAAPPDRVAATDRELLREAEAMSPRIPFRDLDVLVVDEIGKDISGIGMDSKVTGRHRDVVGDFDIQPAPRRIFVRSLSPGSGGNANGIGLADVCHSRVARAMDEDRTFVNALVAASLEKAAVPMHFDSDRKCLAACIATCGCESGADARMVRILNTARLSLMLVSKALETEVREDPAFTLESGFATPVFDEEGNLPAFPDRRDDGM